MKKLTRQQLETEITKAHRAAEQGASTWDAWHNENANRPAVLEFPAGEIFNPGLAGFIWAWKMLGIIGTAPPCNDFAAQGLEATIRIETTFSQALLAADEIEQYRRQVSVE